VGSGCGSRQRIIQIGFRILLDAIAAKPCAKELTKKKNAPCIAGCELCKNALFTNVTRMEAKYIVPRLQSFSNSSRISPQYGLKICQISNHDRIS